MRYVFFHERTGELLPLTKHLSSESLLAANTPTGYVALQHDTADPRRHKVNPETKELLPFIPLSPGDGYEWNEITWAWQLSQDALARRAALCEIRSLEGKQHRALREALLNKPGATQRLQAIDDKIAELRKRITVLSAHAVRKE